MSIVTLSHRLRILLAATSMLIFCAVSNSAFAQYQGGGNTGGGTTGNTGNGGGGNQTQPQLSSVGAEGGENQSPISEFGELSGQMGTGFIGQGAPDSFVGGNQTAQNAGQPQTRNFQQSNNGQNPNQFNQNQQTQTLGSGVSAIKYRPPFKLAFDMPRPTASNVNLNLSRKISHISSRKPVFKGVTFAVTEQNTVTLTGTVKSEDDLQLALLYVKMEAGVDKVVNQLKVEPDSVEGKLLELPKE